MHAPTVLAGAVAAVFAVAAVSKSRDRDDLVGFLRAVGVARGTAPISAVVVFVEAGIAALLPIPSLTTAFSIGAAGMASAFVFVQIRAKRAGIDSGCGCFGFVDDRPGALAVARATALLAACGALVILQLIGDVRAPSPAEQWSSLGVGGLIGVIGVAIFVLLGEVAHFEQHHLDPLHQRELEAS
jgi:integral membrane sensor domain MASE1